MKKYLSEHKTGLIIAAVLIILAVFAICFYSPVRIQEPNMVAYGKDGEKLEFELYIKWHRRLFSEDKAMGAVIIDGVKYETVYLKGKNNNLYDVSGLYFYVRTVGGSMPYGAWGKTVRLKAETPKLESFMISVFPEGGGLATIYGFPEYPQY